jgi:hypothetical protein
VLGARRWWQLETISVDDSNPHDIEIEMRYSFPDGTGLVNRTKTHRHNVTESVWTKQ